MTTAAKSDAELLEAWHGGDTSAAEELYERYFECVDRFLRTKVSALVVEDLVQRTFEVCLSNRKPFEGRSSFKSYILGIANNLVRKHYRDDHPERREPLGEVSVVDLGCTPTEVIMARQEDRMLLEALRKLTLEQQTAIELYFWEDMNRREIAELLGIPDGTVGTRLHDGRLKLERLLGELSQSDERLRSTVTTLADWMQQVRNRMLGPKEPKEPKKPKGR